MYMMYIDDFWNVSNYAIPVKRNSCLNKNSIHLLVACSLESKWTRNSHNNIMYTDGFYPWQRISNVWIICEKKNKKWYSTKRSFFLQYMYLMCHLHVLFVPKFLTIWILMFTYFDTVSLFASMQLQLLSHKLHITETFNRFCFAVL